MNIEATDVGVDELYTRLKAPPIGLKDGPIPVLLAALLLHRADDVAVYQDGTYQPELSADLLERLVKTPQRFAVKAFDPYPFILLNLVLSCVAAIQAPLIMMSQNRQEEKDRRRAENDYKVNLKTEIMIEDLYDKANAILARQTALEKQLTEKGESAGQK